MDCLDKLRPSIKDLIATATWKETKDGDFEISSCSFGNRIFENLASNKYSILKCLAVIAGCGGAIALCTLLPFPLMVIVPIWISPFALMGITKLFMNIFGLPTKLQVSIPSLLVDAILENKGRSAEIKRSMGLLHKCCTTAFAFYYKVHTPSGESTVLDVLSKKSCVDRRFVSSSFPDSQIGTRHQLHDFGEYLLSHSSKQTRSYERIDLTKEAFDTVLNRIERLARGEKVGVLNPQGQEEAVTEDSYVVLAHK
jgi:hypothetical protein